MGDGPAGLGVEMGELLREMLKAVRAAGEADQLALAAEVISEFEVRYDALIQKGYKANPGSGAVRIGLWKWTHFRA